MTSPKQDDKMPVLIWLLPALAVIGSFISLYLALAHPDKEIAVDKVTVIHDGNQVHQHVVNSVTPPLK